MKKTLLFIFLATTSYASSCSISDVLVQMRPGEEWSMSDNNPATLVWISPTTPPTLSEINAGIADCPNQVNLKQRKYAITDLLTAQDNRARLTRAVLMTIFDENNNLREWIQAFKGQVALASSLADLKTRISGLPDMPDRTVVQAKNAVQSKINSGASD